MEYLEWKNSVVPDGVIACRRSQRVLTDARRIRKRAGERERERERERKGKRAYRKSARVRRFSKRGKSRTRPWNTCSLGLNLATVSRSPMGRIAGFHSPARFTFKIEHRPPPRFGSLDFSSQEMRSAPPGNPGCPRFASSPLPPYSFPTFYLAIFRLFALYALDAGRCKVRRIGIKGQMQKD